MKIKTISIVSLLVVTLLLSACGGSITALANQAQQLADQAQQVANQAEGQVTTQVAKQLETSSALAAPAAQGGSELLTAYENALNGVYEAVNPSVVFVSVLKDATTAFSGGQMPNIPNFPDLNPGTPNDQAPENNNPDSNNPDSGQAPQAGGLGSGFVWDSEGHIVTNNHVVDGATKIEVTFSDGTSLPATVVGTDPYSDLAVIQVDGAGDLLKPVTMGDSSQVKVGELAIAIGNPYGLANTMTVGIVSALGRSIPAGEMTQFTGNPRFTIPDIIQTDAPINPGNSGGVLVNDIGEVIGVTTAIESSSGAGAGIGFVVPSATVSKVVPTLIEKGGYQHPYLGISGSTLIRELATAMKLDANTHGALVGEVVKDGPADQAGLIGSTQETTIDGQTVPVGGDVIIALNGDEIKSMDDLIATLLGKTSVGDTVTLTILRDGKQMDVKVTLGERPQQ
jgi:serine protease Do